MLPSKAPSVFHSKRAFHGGSRGLVYARSAVQSSGSKSAKKLLKNVPSDAKEAHRIFDEAFITVRSGDGGQGEIVQKGRGRWVPNNKYQPGGQQPKKIWLPASAPADGSDGADVVLVVDPSLDNLVHLHARKQYNAPKGANANPAVGSSGPKANRDMKKKPTPPFEIPVPPGTVVKRKSNGLLLGDLTNKGDRLVVAYGGRGGMGLVAPSREQRLSNMDKQYKQAQAAKAEVIDIQDTNWKVDSLGSPGQQLSLHLLLRVVADVGIVGLPNAGKSSLLKALTRASPEVAPYPFTTLMPNLGVLAAGGPKAVLADLPGLIEGAHTGRGLGRMFLRHLRRTCMIMHVVDCSLEDPATDYFVVREELRMYNPEYCARPHVVVLNKFDLPAASHRCEETIAALLSVSQKHCTDFSGEEIKPTPPTAIVLCSAATGEGLGELNRALAEALQPQKLQGVLQQGTAAIQVLRPPLPSAAPAGLALEQQQQHEAHADEVLLGMANSSWSGAGTAGFEEAREEGGDDEEEEDEEQPAGADSEDGWMLELSDSQLLKLLDQDEARCTSREAAAAAAGLHPYGDESISPDGSISTPVGQLGAAQLAGSSAAAGSYAAGDMALAAACSSGEAQGDGDGVTWDEGAVAEDFDLEDLEGLEEELTQEERELLQFLREQESTGLADAASGQLVQSITTGNIEECGHDDERWLLELTDEQLLELADKEPESSRSPQGGAESVRP